MKLLSLSHPYVMALCMAMGMSLAPAYAAAPHEHAPAAATGKVGKKEATDQALRDLWGQHVYWVRNYVVASVDKNEAARSEAEKQVVENAKAISAAVAQFYGQAGGDQLLKLLAGHWGAVKAYADANDKAGSDKAVETLNANAGEIASFLSTANPYLKKDAVLALLAAHGGHHVQQINQLKAGDYAAEAQTWEVMRKHMYTLADTLTDALAKQFPKRF